jgi:two-component system, OmpR family, response regulator
MRILIAEDDSDTARRISECLAGQGHEVAVAATGPAALELASLSLFDVMILDRLLPGIDGLSVMTALRARDCDTPVLMLTALGGIADRVEGLEAGADDYLVKPFATDELVARVHALGRRPVLGAATTRLQAGDIVLDLMRRQCSRAGRSVLLQPREFELLELLVRNSGRVVTRKMFLEGVWGFRFDPQTNIVQSHLSRLRAKLREGFDTDPIETVRGEGYILRTGG